MCLLHMVFPGHSQLPHDHLFGGIRKDDQVWPESRLPDVAGELQLTTQVSLPGLAAANLGRRIIGLPLTVGETGAFLQP